MKTKKQTNMMKKNIVLAAAAAMLLISGVGAADWPPAKPEAIRA